MQDDSPNRLSDSLETLNARVARLAIGLGVDLSDPTVLSKLMQQSPHPAVTVDRRMAAPAAHVRPAASVVFHICGRSCVGW